MAGQGKLQLLVQKLRDDQHRRWEEGTRRTVEQYLSTHPELETDREALLDLIYSEIRLREQFGEVPTIQEYASRFPALVAELVRLFEVHKAVQHLPSRSASLDATQANDQSASVSSSLPPLPQQVGDYEILGEIARGGMGVVYKAWQRSLNRTVALKLIRDGELADPEQIVRFRSEAETAARLEHPGIVPIFEVGHEQGRHYFAMALVEGQSLHEQLRDGPLPPVEAARIVQQTAEAVHFAHTKRVVHRDLKPQNVLIDAKGSPKVVDFGLAKRLDLAEGFTATGALLGTPSYMAPEQALGSTKELGPAVDVYGLGAVLYAALTGRPPFQAAAVADVLCQVLEREPVAPRQLNAAIPRDLDTICLKCLEKSPARRYGSAEELAADLGRYLRNEPILARPIGRLEHGWRWCIRNPLPAGLSVAAALLVVTIALVSTLAYFREAYLTTIADRKTEEAVQAEANAKAQEANAEKQKEMAEKSANQARQAEVQAVDAASLATQSEQEAQQSLYYANIGLAHRYLQEGDVEPAGEILDRCPLHFRRWEWWFLKDLTTKGRRIILRNDKARCLTFSPDGRLIAIGTEKGELYLWDDAARRVLFQKRIHEKSIVRVAFNPDGKTLATASDDDTARILAMPEGELKFELPGPIAPLGGGLIFSRDGKRLAGASLDGTIHIWDAAGGKLQRVLSCKDGVRGIAWGPDSDSLFSLAFQGTLIRWNTLDGQRSDFLKAGRNSYALGCSADGHSLAACGNSFLKVWNIRESKPAIVFSDCKAHYTSVGLSADGRTLAASSYGAGTFVYEVASGRRMYRLSNVDRIVLSPDATRAAVIEAGGIVEVCRTSVQMETYSLGPGLGDLETCNPCCAYGLFSTDNAVYEAGTGAKLLTLESETSPDHRGLFQGTISPDGRSLFHAANDGTLQKYDLSTGFALRQTSLCSPGKDPPQWTISPDSKYAAVAAHAGRIRIVDAIRNDELGIIKNVSDGLAVSCLRFAPQGDLLAAMYSDGGVRLWKWRTGELCREFGKHDTTSDGRCCALAFSADGQFLASGGGRDDRTIRIWRRPDWVLLHALRGHWNGIQSLAFSRDGSRLLSGGEDGTIRLWDAVRGQEILQVDGHQGRVFHAAFTDDDRAIVSNGSIGVARLWGGLSAAVPVGQRLNLLPWLRRYGDEKHAGSGSAVGVSLTSTESRVVPIPVAPDGSYVLRGKFRRTRSGGRKTIGFLLPAGKGKTMLALDHETRAKSGFDGIENHGANDPANPTSCPVHLVDGRSYTFEVRVEQIQDQAQASVQLDGREIIHWEGRQSALTMYSAWELPDSRMTGLALGDVDVTIEQLELTPLDAGTRLLELPPEQHTAPPPGTTVVAAPGTVDLLPLVDLERAVFDATAKRSDGGLELSADKPGRVALPVLPRGKYELSGSFTIPDKGIPLFLIPTAHSRGLIHWRWSDENSSDSCSGFENIAGKNVMSVDNPTRISPSKVQAGRRHVFRVRVACEDGDADIAVELDGTPYFQWKGPESAISLRPEWEVPHQQVLGIGMRRGRAIYHELKLKMLSGEAWILKPTANIPASSSSPASATKPPTGEAPPPPGEAKNLMRTWTDSSGQQHIEAAFVGQVDGQVRLRWPDGKEVNLALEKLSPADQEWVRQQGKQ